MDKYTLEALNRLLEYVYDDEERDFSNLATEAEQKTHIFNDIKLLSSWVQDKQNNE